MWFRRYHPDKYALAVYDAVLPNQVWLQMDRQFRRLSRNKSYFDYISPHCDLVTMKTANQFFSTGHSGLWCCITIPSLVPKWSVVQKMSSEQTFTNFLTFAVTLTVDEVTQFLHKTLWLMMLYYQTKSSCKWTSRYSKKIVIFWLYKPLLWPWHWR